MSKNIFLLFLSCSLLVFANGGEARAAGCGCGSVSSIVNSARASLSGQIIGVKTAVMSESALIQGQILQAATNLIGTIKTENAMVIRAIQDNKETISNAVKGLGAAMHAQQTKDLYGNASRPVNLCEQHVVGGGIQVGSRTQAAVAYGLQQETAQFVNRYGRSIDYLKKSTDPDKIPTFEKGNASFFPPERTMSKDDTANAVEIIKLINPMPSLEIKEPVSKTPAGQIYAAHRNTHEFRTTLNANIFNEYIAERSSTLDESVTDWAINQWQTNATGQSNLQATPPGVVDGKLSQAALYNLLSQLRVGNPNWSNNIGEMNDTGLLRELVMIQAFQFELTRQNNEKLDRIALALAIMNATNLDGLNKAELDQIYKNAIGAQQ